MGFLAAILDSGPIFRRRKSLFRLVWSKVPESIEKTLTGKRCDYVLARTGLVAQSVETWLGNRRVDSSSPAIGGGDFDVSFYIYLGNRLMYLLCH